MRIGFLVTDVHALATTASVPTTEPAAPEWKPKALPLGASVQTVQGVTPGLDCEPHAHDSGLTYSIDRQATLVDKPAVLIAKLLGGEAVHIALEDLAYEQLVAADPTPLERYGNSTASDAVAGNAHEPHNIRAARRSRDIWRHDGGRLAAMSVPFDWTDERLGITHLNIAMLVESKEKHWAGCCSTRDLSTDQ